MATTERYTVKEVLTRVEIWSRGSAESVERQGARHYFRLEHDQAGRAGLCAGIIQDDVATVLRYIKGTSILAHGRWLCRVQERGGGGGQFCLSPCFL